MPFVGHDRRPEQPQSLLRIDEYCAVRVRIAGNIRHREPLTPGLRSTLHSRALDLDVIRLPLPRSIEPADQKIAIRTLDYHRRMIVPVLERKDQLRPHKWSFLTLPGATRLYDHEKEHGGHRQCSKRWNQLTHMFSVHTGNLLTTGRLVKVNGGDCAS